MSEGAKVAVGRGAIGKEVKHGGLTLGVEERRAALSGRTGEAQGWGKLRFVSGPEEWLLNWRAQR